MIAAERIETKYFCDREDVKKRPLLLYIKKYYFLYNKLLTNNII